MEQVHSLEPRKSPLDEDFDDEADEAAAEAAKLEVEELEKLIAAEREAADRKRPRDRDRDRSRERHRDRDREGGRERERDREFGGKERESKRSRGDKDRLSSLFHAQDLGSRGGRGGGGEDWVTSISIVTKSWTTIMLCSEVEFAAPVNSKDF
jgi:hypothetical protein